MSCLEKTAIACLLSSFVAAPAVAGLHFGEPVERAAALHVTQQGLDRVGDAIEGLVPRSFPIENIAGEMACSEEDAQPLTYAMDSLEVLISADDVQIVASDGRLDITLYGTLGSNASTFYVQGDCSVLTDLDEACSLQLPTTSISAHLGMQITEWEGIFDVEVDDLSIDISPITNPLADCTLASVIGTLLGQDEQAISNLLLSFIEPELEGLDATIEEAVEDALNQLSLDTELALGEVPLALALYPTWVEFGDSGIIFGFGSRIDAEGTSDCVDASEGSPFADSPWPELSTYAPGTDLAYDVGLVVSRDFVDHVLWAVWASGTLCIELEELAGAELQTSLLESFFGESFTELFPEAQPALVAVDPTGQPLAVFSDDEPPLAVAVEDLGLQLYSELDQRDARIFRVGVDADVGLSVDIDSKAVTPQLFLDPADFTYTESYNDLLDEGFSANFQDLVSMVLDMFLPDDLLSPFELPDTYGVAVGGVFWVPSPDDAWHGAYVLVDTTQVESLELGGCSGGSLGCGEGDTGTTGIDLGELGCDEEGGCSGCSDEGGGCDEDGGCGDSGCSEGSSCGTSRGLRIPRLAPGRLLLFLALAGAILVRRQRR